MESGVFALFGRAEKEAVKFNMVLAGKHDETDHATKVDLSVLIAPRL
jgi:hypothetical protein